MGQPGTATSVQHQLNAYWEDYLYYAPLSGPSTGILPVTPQVATAFSAIPGLGDIVDGWALTDGSNHCQFRDRNSNCLVWSEPAGAGSINILSTNFKK